MGSANKNKKKTMSKTIFWSSKLQNYKFQLSEQGV